MAEKQLKIIDGPDKPALQWAVAYPEEQEVNFKVEGDTVDARIDRIDEKGEGFSFELEGVLTSGTYKNAPFRASYSVESRSGAIRVLA